MLFKLATARWRRQPSGGQTSNLGVSNPSERANKILIKSWRYASLETITRLARFANGWVAKAQKLFYTSAMKAL
jgi:hypothetical protein